MTSVLLCSNVRLWPRSPDSELAAEFGGPVAVLGVLGVRGLAATASSSENFKFFIFI
jgi:hypothetical protein